jgi:AIPR protein
MNINASIIDQRLTIIQDEIRERANNELNISSPDKVFSLAFVYLCAKTMLDLDDVEAFNCLTEGGGDFGVDAMHISEEYDGEFTISLFQGKYKRNLAADSNYPENAINDLINAIRYIFDPSAQLNHVNDQLLVQVENARSLIRDGYIPQVRALACNNGLCWNAAAQESIARSGFGNQVTWEHVNHDRLVDIIRSTKPVNDNLQLTGQAIVEDMDFSRVLVGRISTTEIAALIARHGERLLERNVRRYLGLQGNRVNEAIQNTLQGAERSNFYFYNNGITLTCDKFSYNALQKDDYQVRIENLQIINGGQTCMTIHKTLQQLISFDETPTYVLVRLYQLPSENDDLVRRITFATNSQNPVDLRDLKANDDQQQRLEIDVQQLGYTYRRKRSDQGTRSDISSGVAAEAILSVWRRAPHQAKFFTREHFGKLYETIFTNDLNGAQLIIAVLIYRIAENRRRRPESSDPPFVRYASCFIAMQMGRHLLDELAIEFSVLNHKNFTQAVHLIEKKGSIYFNQSLQDIETALASLYGEATVSLQQLSATFRRGDLIQILLEISQGG